MLENKIYLSKKIKIFNSSKKNMSNLNSKLIVIFKNIIYKISTTTEVLEDKIENEFMKHRNYEFKNYRYVKKNKFLKSNLQNIYKFYKKINDADAKFIFYETFKKMFIKNTQFSILNTVFILKDSFYMYSKLGKNLRKYLIFKTLLDSFKPSNELYDVSRLWYYLLKETLKFARIRGGKLPVEDSMARYTISSPYKILIHNPAQDIGSKSWLGIKSWNNNKYSFYISDIFDVSYKSFKKLLLKSYRRNLRAVNTFSSKNTKNKNSYKKSLSSITNSWGNVGMYHSARFKRDMLYVKTEYVNSRNKLKGYVYNIENFKNLNKNSKKIIFNKLKLKSLINCKSKLVKINYSKKQQKNIRLFTNSSNMAYFNWIKTGFATINKSIFLNLKLSRIGISSNRFDIFYKSKHFGHPFHLVNPSILPVTLSFVFFAVIQDILSSFLLEMWYYNIFSVLGHTLILGLFFSVIISWIFEVYSEEQSGAHTLEVQKGFQYAILLFILSELMLFISFFWAYFHFSLNSNSFTGGSYTPMGLVPFYWYRIPLLNTLLLLASGLSLTLAHILVIESDKLVRLVLWINAMSNQISLEYSEPLKIKATKSIFQYLLSENVKEVKTYNAFFYRFYLRFFLLFTKFNGSKIKIFNFNKALGYRNYNHLERISRVSYDFQINLPKSFLINFKNMPRNTIWQPNYWLLDTVIKGFIFLIFQAYEYTSCMFSINDGVYGAVFFSLTGLHGIHVFLGVMFLFFSLLVNLKKTYRKLWKSHKSWRKYVHLYTDRGLIALNSYKNNVWTHRIAFDAAAWYWHFVDVVWFFVFVFVYWWGVYSD